MAETEIATKLKTINDIQFPITQPYSEGMVMGAAEARALNQTRSENIGNNCRAKIKEMLAEGKSEKEIKKYVSAVDAEYVLTLTAARGVGLDPVEREAQKIARELIKQVLAQSGRKLTVPPEGETKESWDEKVSAEVEKIAAEPDVIEAAKAEVKAKKERAENLANKVAGIQIGE